MRRAIPIAAVLAIGLGALLALWLTAPPADAPGSARRPAPARPRPSDAGPNLSVPHARLPDATLTNQGESSSEFTGGGDASAREAPRVGAPGAPTASAWLLGRIVDPADAPVAGAAVLVRGDDGVRATTDAGGSFRLGPIEPAPVVEFAVEASGFMDEAFEVALPLPGLYDVGAIRLSEGASVAGQVAYEDGRPAADAGIRVYRGEDRVLEADSGADGRFRLRGLRPGRYTVRAYREGLYDGRDFAIQDAVATVEVDLVLRRAPTGRVEGTVRSFSGEPIQGAEVHFDLVGLSLGSIVVAGHSTDTDGRFARDLEPGVYAVRARAPGHAPAVAEVALAAGARATLDLRLGRPGAAIGRLDVPEGVTAGAVEIVLVDGREAISGAAQSDGSTRFDDLEPRRYRAVAGAAPHVSDVHPAAGIETKEIEVREGQTTHFTLGAARPVRVPIRLSGLEHDPRASVALVAPGLAAPLATATRAPDGTLELEAEQGPATLEIRASAPGGGWTVVTRHDIDVQPGAEVSIALDPDRQGAIRGRLSPAPGERVSVRAIGPSADATADSAPDGRFALGPLPAGRYRVVAERYTLVEVDVPAGGVADVTIGR